ncbi:uncharacterized protein LOC118647729 [Monomorium pharaonis]|uniref:uncharacterized protein LOC118647729 n=1 Tax=Monomorium pharaonis TaxID=307658 RepID=UPI001746B51E|nr:uncharacterized protein LOC118647729 [Monomorium pharaonis]
MKDYICVVLLLVCGVTYFPTQVQGGCEYSSIFGFQIFDVGIHTVHPCAQVTCYENGTIITKKCRELSNHCTPDEQLVSYTFDDNFKDYPACCPRAICMPRLD